MKVSVVAPGDLAGAEVAEWARLQESEPGLASPFLSHGFAVAFARYRPGTRVAVVTDDAGVTGFFPHEVGRAGFGRAVGMGYSDVQGLVAPAAFDLDARALLRACGLRAWRFDHLLATQATLLSGAPHRWVEDRSPVIDLSDGWEAYSTELRKTSASLQSSTARRRRALERDHGPVSLTFSDPDHRLLDQLIEWKSEQYRRTGRRDVLAEPGMRRLLHELLDHQETGFGAPLTVLRAGDEVVAAHLGLRSPSVLAWWFPVYSTRFSRYSPGLVLALGTAQEMCDHGIRLMDLGKGEESYKQRLANGEHAILAGSVSRDPVVAGLTAARRWPMETVRGLLHAHPAVRSRVADLRIRVASARTRVTDVIADG